MMIEKLEISEESGQLHVFIQLKEFCRNLKVPKHAIDTNYVMQILKEKKVSHGNLISGPKELKNWNLKTISGTWIFEKKIAAKPKRTTKKTPAKKKATGG